MTDAREGGPVTRPNALPPELKRWNWGAFFLNWVWGLAHNTPIALLMFVPGVNIVMPFVLGAKGNQWAWANNTWRDIEDFKRSQRIWARVGLGAFVGVPLFAGLIVGIVLASLNTSDPYRLTVEYLRDHPRLERRLGRPVEPSGWWTSGNIEIHNDTGWAALSFDVEGPKGGATVYVNVEKNSDTWTIRQLNVFIQDGEQIQLVGRDGGSREGI